MHRRAHRGLARVPAAEDRFDRDPPDEMDLDPRLRPECRSRPGAVHGLDHRLRARRLRVHLDGARSSAGRCRWTTSVPRQRRRSPTCSGSPTPTSRRSPRPPEVLRPTSGRSSAHGGNASPARLGRGRRRGFRRRCDRHRRARRLDLAGSRATARAGPTTSDAGAPRASAARAGPADPARRSPPRSPPGRTRERTPRPSHAARERSAAASTPRRPTAPPASSCRPSCDQVSCSSSSSSVPNPPGRAANPSANSAISAFRSWSEPTTWSSDRPPCASSRSTSSRGITPITSPPADNAPSATAPIKPTRPPP